MKIYHFDHLSHEYLGESDARPSPLEPGVYLIPANATEYPPPVASENQAAVFDAGVWSLQPDFRGQWYAGRDQVTITDIGPLPAGYTKNPQPLTKIELLATLLSNVDAAVATKQQLPFQYDGHTWYPDTEFIQGMFSAVTAGLLPSNHVETWKTADVESDGITNVYVQLTVAGIIGLAGAYLINKKTIWSQGEVLKQNLKGLCLDDTKTPVDLLAVEITL